MPVLAVLVAALILVPTAAAKGKMTLVLGDSTPAVGQKITVLLRMPNWIAKPNVIVVAVAPGRNWYDVVGVVTGQSRIARADIPRDGFGIELTHVGGDRWRAFVSFPRRGRWQLAVPNWGGAAGFAVPPPILRSVAVG
jgi:hypothetical protein